MLKLFRRPEPRKPDYIIIGVQKGGTTTLYHQLSQHPQIDNPSIKEIHYFDLQYDKPLNNYWKFFKDCKKEKLTGEASPYYFFHPHVAARIKKHVPNAKFIVMLRNPVDRAYSHYQMKKRSGDEPFSFDQAVLKEEERIKLLYESMVLDDSKNYKEVQFYSYLLRGEYAKQLKQWLAYFEKDRFLFIESEEYFSDPEKELRRVHSFLGLDYVKPADLDNKFQGGYKEKAEAVTAERLDKYFKEANKELPELTGRKFSWL